MWHSKIVQSNWTCSGIIIIVTFQLCNCKFFPLTRKKDINSSFTDQSNYGLLLHCGEGLYTISNRYHYYAKDLRNFAKNQKHSERWVHLESESSKDIGHQIRKRQDSSHIFGNSEDLAANLLHKEKYENISAAHNSVWLREIVRFHNVLRKLHGVEELELDYELAHAALLWAMQLANKSSVAGKLVLESSLPEMSSKYGENLGARNGGTRSRLLQLPGSFPVRIWYAEVANHDWERNYWQTDSGHFTQVIWSTTKRLGCGRAVTKEKCDPDGKMTQRAFYIVVCHYWPPGNWLHHNAFVNHVYPSDEGEPNKVPDFTQFCPEKSIPCPRPMVCCTGNDTVTNVQSICQPEVKESHSDSSQHEGKGRSMGSMRKGFVGDDGVGGGGNNKQSPRPEGNHKRARKIRD